MLKVKIEIISRVVGGRLECQICNQQTTFIAAVCRQDRKIVAKIPCCDKCKDKALKLARQLGREILKRSLKMSTAII